MECDFAEQLSLVEQALAEAPHDADLLAARASLLEIARMRGEIACLVPAPPDMFSHNFEAPRAPPASAEAPAAPPAPLAPAPPSGFVSGGTEALGERPSGAPAASDGSSSYSEQSSSDDDDDGLYGAADVAADVADVADAADAAPPLLLARWEQHTRGVGSRLLLAMGYRAGQGLGVRGDGPRDPIDAGRAPRGRSEAAAGIGHHRRLRALERQQHGGRSGRRAGSVSPAPTPSVFAFLNDKLGGARAVVPEPAARTAGGAAAKSEEELRREARAVRERLREAEASARRYGEGFERNRGRDDTAARAMRTAQQRAQADIARLSALDASIAGELDRRSANRRAAKF